MFSSSFRLLFEARRLEKYTIPIFGSRLQQNIRPAQDSAVIVMQDIQLRTFFHGFNVMQRLRARESERLIGEQKLATVPQRALVYITRHYSAEKIEELFVNR